MTGLGLGLSDAEVYRLEKRADRDGSGHVSWEEFLPIGVQTLGDIFNVQKWSQQSPWVKLYDRGAQHWYYFNRSSGDSEWVDGTNDQASRVGLPFSNAPNIDPEVAREEKEELPTSSSISARQVSSNQLQPDNVDLEDNTSVVEIQGAKEELKPAPISTQCSESPVIELGPLSGELDKVGTASRPVIPVPFPDLLENIEKEESGSLQEGREVHISEVTMPEILLPEPCQPRKTTVGIPLRGLLSLQGREIPDTWCCGVCSHLEALLEDRCQECQCSRVASWMYNPNGLLIEPGMLVVATQWTPLTTMSNSRLELTKEYFESSVAVVTNLLRRSKQVELCLLWHPKRVTQDAIFEAKVCYEPVIASVNVVKSKQGLRVPLTAYQPPPYNCHHSITAIQYFAQLGYCGNEGCERLYDIANGDLFGDDDEVLRLKERIVNNNKELVELKLLKAAYKKSQDHHGVTQVNEKISQALHKLKLNRRKAAPQQTWCPFCTWAPVY